MYSVQASIQETIRTLLAQDKVNEGLAFIEADHPQAIAEQKHLVTIEAPTFAEEKRAAAYADYLRELGLDEVYLDKDGNVISRLKGTGGGPTILLEGHLDTVFAAGTDVTPIEKDGKIYAPGICDDTRALAANLSVIRAFRQTGLRAMGDIIFAGTRAEEGMGGMSGMRNLLNNVNGIGGAISIDGAGCDSIIFEATGIINYEVTYTGPGGHAYVAFGTPSANHAAARAITKLSNLEVPQTPKTTYTVSLMEGGQAIHGISQTAKFTINMRSDSADVLAKLEEEAIRCFSLGAEEETLRWGKNEITVSYKKILSVPAGTQPADCAIVQAAWAVTKELGVEPQLVSGGCTNTNMAIFRDIPAVTLGRGGKEGGTHSLGEWFDPTGTFICPQKSFLLLLALAGVAQVTEPILKK